MFLSYSLEVNLENPFRVTVIIEIPNVAQSFTFSAIGAAIIAVRYKGRE